MTQDKEAWKCTAYSAKSCKKELCKYCEHLPVGEPQKYVPSSSLDCCIADSASVAAGSYTDELRNFGTKFRAKVTAEEKIMWEDGIEVEINIRIAADEIDRLEHENKKLRALNEVPEF